ncbi:MAG: glycosyltransferase [Hyphomicrobium sp.]
MRLFQNSGVVRSYVPRLSVLTRNSHTFQEHTKTFLADRYGATHFLKPVLDGAADAFFTNGDVENCQRAWARENGLKATTPLEDVLLAQIEAHRTDVFYNMDPVRYGSGFVRRLPQSVKRKIAWRAAPSGNADYSAYDLIVSNFPSILESYKAKGWRSDYFFPGHDPEMEPFAANTERPIDVLFVGGYSRHHRNRAVVLEAVALLRDKHRIVYHLDKSSLTTLGETPLGWVGPLKKHRRPRDIRSVSAPPIFGRDLYTAFSNTKIVLNGAIDMAGTDRGNMRCWEAMGCGALLVSDEGVYPAGMERDQTIMTYSSAEQAAGVVERALTGDSARRQAIARTGHDMIRTRYSKEKQWARFLELV